MYQDWSKSDALFRSCAAIWPCLRPSRLGHLCAKHRCLSLLRPFSRAGLTILFCVLRFAQAQAAHSGDFRYAVHIPMPQYDRISIASVHSFFPLCAWLLPLILISFA